MLKSLRNNTKTFIWITAGLFIGSYVVGSAMSLKNRKTSYAAKVFNKKISKQEYQKYYDIIFFSPRIQSLFRQNADVPESLIITTALQYIALHKEARKRGIKVSDQEVKDEITRRFSYQGVFNPKLYERHVRTVMRRDLSWYEDTLRKELVINKLLNSFRAQAEVTNEEVKKAFDLDNQQFNIQYFTVNDTDFENEIPVIDETLRSFYDENKSLFKVDEKYDFAFMLFDHNTYLDEITVGESQINTYYDDNISSFIDPDTEKPRSIDEVRDEIIQILKSKEARLIAKENAINTQNRIKALRDVSKGAQEAGVSVQKTGYKTAKELENVFGWTPNFYNKLSTLPPKAIRVIQTDTGAYVLVLNEKKYAYTPPYPEIINKVKKKYVSVTSHERAQERAQKIVDEITAGTLSFQEAFNQEGGIVNEFGPFSTQIIPASSPFEPIPQFVAFLMDYAVNDVTPPYPVENGMAIVKITESIEPDEELFEKNRSLYEEKIRSFKGNQILNYEVSKILKDADIKNYLLTKDDPFADIR